MLDGELICLPVGPYEVLDILDAHTATVVLSSWSFPSHVTKPMLCHVPHTARRHPAVHVDFVSFYPFRSLMFGSQVIFIRDLMFVPVSPSSVIA